MKQVKSTKNTTLNNLCQELILMINKFEYKIYIDPYWEFMYSNGKRKWFHLKIGFYKENYSITQMIGEEDTIRIKAKEHLIVEKYMEDYWLDTIGLGISFLKAVSENPLKCYTDLVKTMPYKYRSGLLKKSLLWEFDKNLFRYDKKLTKVEKNLICKLIEERVFAGNSTTLFKSMTANKYFQLCKIAYLAYHQKLDDADKKLTGRALYKRYADGRHEGLLDIRGNSANEFNLWFTHKHPKYNGGGHPWEIFRNRGIFYISTNSYLRSEDQYKVSLTGISTSFVSEFIRVALALYKEGVIIYLGDYDEMLRVRDRLIGQDYVGIVPYHIGYIEDDMFDKIVDDTINLDEIKTKDKRLLEVIQWNDIPFIYPKK